MIENICAELEQETNRQAPIGTQNGYFSSEDFWWYDTNGQMLRTAFSSAGVALAGAAAVILISSRSFILTLFATITIGYVLTSVTATLVAIGWTLGFLESICFAILIGVSVDFVIHFTHAYSKLAGHHDRGIRTKYAVITMGPSILATACTTIASAVIMLFTVITFFQKFALILFFTIIQATLGSFVVFLVMADCIGPGNPTYLLDRCSEWSWTLSHQEQAPSQALDEKDDDSNTNYICNVFEKVPSENGVDSSDVNAHCQDEFRTNTNVDIDRVRSRRIPSHSRDP